MTGDAELLLFATGIFMLSMYKYHIWDAAKREKTPRQMTLLKAIHQPIKYDPEQACYPPFCPDASGANAAFKDRTQGSVAIRGQSQDRIHDYYADQINARHQRSHTNPLYSGNVQGSEMCKSGVGAVSQNAKALCEALKEDLQCTNSACMTLAPVVHFRSSDMYDSRHSLQPGLSAKDA